MKINEAFKNISSKNIEQTLYVKVYDTNGLSYNNCLFLKTELELTSLARSLPSY